MKEKLIMKLKIFNCDARGMSQVHAADCADCKKVQKSGKHNAGFRLDFSVEEHADRLSVSRSIWSDMISEGSMTAEGGLAEIDFAPCCKSLPQTA
jgi:hypothetical protein